MSKATFDTAGLTGAFNKDNMNNQFNSVFQGDSSPLRPRAQSTPDLTVAVASSIPESYYSPIWLSSSTLSTYTGGNSPAISVPDTHPRIDLLYLNTSDELAWVTGDQSSSPAIPRFTVAGVPICLVYCKTSMSTIVNYESKDASPDEGYLYRDIRPAFLNTASGIPTGTGPLPWPTNSAPVNWLLCYGQAVSRDTYSALYAVISDTFGSGNGSTTFNLPDLRGRTPLGKDNMGGVSADRVTNAQADTVGGASGSEDHDHNAATGSGYGRNANGHTYGSGVTNYDPASHTHGITGDLNMTPYLTLNYIIKA